VFIASFFILPLASNLLEVCPQLVCLLLVLDAREYHFCTGYLALWVFYVFLECLFVPEDTRIFVRIRIAEIWNGASRSTI
jgi:hypothetical protein